MKSILASFATKAVGISFIVVIRSVFVIGEDALPDRRFAFLTCLANFLSLGADFFVAVLAAGLALGLVTFLATGFSRVSSASTTGVVSTTGAVSATGVVSTTGAVSATGVVSTTGAV